MNLKSKICRLCKASFVPVAKEEYCNKCLTFKIINTKEVKHNDKFKRNSRRI